MARDHLFPTAITTNFDKLLENAFQKSVKPNAKR